MEGEHLSVVTRGGREKPSETLILAMRMNAVVMTIMISQKELFFFRVKAISRDEEPISNAERK